VLDYLLLIY